VVGGPSSVVPRGWNGFILIGTDFSGYSGRCGSTGDWRLVRGPTGARGTARPTRDARRARPVRPDGLSRSPAPRHANPPGRRKGPEKRHRSLGRRSCALASRSLRLRGRSVRVQARRDSLSDRRESLQCRHEPLHDRYLRLNFRSELLHRRSVPPYRRIMGLKLRSVSLKRRYDTLRRNEPLTPAGARASAGEGTSPCGPGPNRSPQWVRHCGSGHRAFASVHEFLVVAGSLARPDAPGAAIRRRASPAGVRYLAGGVYEHQRQTAHGHARVPLVAGNDTGVSQAVAIQ